MLIEKEETMPFSSVLKNYKSEHKLLILNDNTNLLNIDSLEDAHKTCMSIYKDYGEDYALIGHCSVQGRDYLVTVKGGIFEYERLLRDKYVQLFFVTLIVSEVFVLLGANLPSFVRDIDTIKKHLSNNDEQTTDDITKCIVFDSAVNKGIRPRFESCIHNAFSNLKSVYYVDSGAIDVCIIK